MTKKATRAGRLMTVAVAAVSLFAVAIPLSSAHAQLLGQIYLGYFPPDELGDHFYGRH